MLYERARLTGDSDANANNIDTIKRYDMESLTSKTKGRSPVVYEYCGVRKTVKEWSEFLGLATPQAFYMRLLAFKRGEATQHEIFQPAAPQAGHRKRQKRRGSGRKEHVQQSTPPHARRAGDKRST